MSCEDTGSNDTHWAESSDAVHQDYTGATAPLEVETTHCLYFKCKWMLSKYFRQGVFEILHNGSIFILTKGLQKRGFSFFHTVHIKAYNETRRGGEDIDKLFKVWSNTPAGEGDVGSILGLILW